jgi:hypothetical protein
MNSLPLIHHHLFAAAISNDERGHPKPSRPDGRSAEPTGPARVVELDVLDDETPVHSGTTRSLREAVNPARA